MTPAAAKTLNEMLRHADAQIKSEKRVPAIAFAFQDSADQSVHVFIDAADDIVEMLAGRCLAHLVEHAPHAKDRARFAAVLGELRGGRP